MSEALCIESFGVSVLIESNDPAAIAACREIVRVALPDCHTIVPCTEYDHRFTLIWNNSGRDSLYRNGEPVALRTNRERVLSMLEPRLRLVVAEYTKDYVFIHAGVVVWKGKALVIPGGSMHGKTSLVLELVKSGAIYYSDEYAILDKDGFIHPFAKTLSVRGGADKYKQEEREVESFGGSKGVNRVRPDAVLFTKFDPESKWQPCRLSGAEGVLELLRDTIATRQNPHFVLEVLTKIAHETIFIKTPRPDARACKDKIASLLEGRYFQNDLQAVSTGL